MLKKKRKSPVEVFIKHIESDGYELDGIASKAGKVGNYYGEVKIDEADERPIEITAKNLPSLGDREVVADGVTVTLSVMGKEQDVRVETLRFTKGTSHWPAQIRDQIPEIAEMVALRRCLREVMDNPRLQKQFVASLQKDEDAQKLLKAITAAE